MVAMLLAFTNGFEIIRGTPVQARRREGCEMTYLILESRAAYCVALGEDGRCVKCANMHCEVGDRVENIVELKMPRAPGQ